MSAAGALFGELLKRHRAAAGLSQRDLAARSGLSERSVRNLESGSTTRPRQHGVLALADALRLAGAERSAFVALARNQAETAVPLTASGDLLGRTGDLQVLVDLVRGERHRIITVTGPGGVGKSRLVAELVEVLRHDGLDVRALDVSTVTAPDLVEELAAEAFEVLGGRLPGVERLAAALHGRRAVLVLDGFDQLVAAAASLADLVRRCPRLTVVVGSQRALRISRERRVPLEPLPLPVAMELFVRRARDVSPGLSLDDDNRPAIAAICRRVDGLPLAVELAAARARHLTPAEIADRLGRSFPLLTGGLADTPRRHRSLRATVEASLASVSADGQALFARLAAFPAGVRLDDLEAAVGGELLLDSIAELVDASLLRVRGEGSRSRYLLLAAMRELAGELLAGRPEGPAVRRAAAGRYLDRLRAAGARRDGLAYAELDADLDNVRFAVEWCRDHHVGAFSREVIDALWRYHELRGRYVEGRLALTALAGSGVRDAPLALLRAAHLAQLGGAFPQAESLASSALDRLAPGNHADRAIAGLVLGALAGQRGDFGAARSHTTNALLAGRAVGDDEVVGRALNNLAAASSLAGDLRTAARLWRETIAAKQRAGVGDVDLGRTLMNVAELTLALGDWPGAREHAGRAAALLERGGHARLQAIALSVLALASLDGGRAGDTAGALRAMTQAVDLLADFGDDGILRGLVLARRSVVLHAAGHRGVAAVLREGLSVMHEGSVRPEVPPLLEAHAALLAPTAPAVAARLLGLSQAVRDEDGNTQPALLRPVAATLQICAARLGAATVQREVTAGSVGYSSTGFRTAADLIAEALQEQEPAETGSTG